MKNDHTSNIQAYTSVIQEELKMPQILQTLPSLRKTYLLKCNEETHCHNNDPLVCGRSLICPKTLIKHKDMDSGTGFLEEKDCKDSLTDVHSEKIKDVIQKSSGDDKHICINGESSSRFQHFNKQYCGLNENNFGFQCRQWLDTPEKDLFLNAAFVAQAVRRRKHSLNRDDLCFQWLNIADSELFLNTACAAKSSRRRHTR